jgi:phage shock protein PspC (stress-responsive transcriptional regulator)
MYCSNCGQEEPAGAKFCPHCGRATQVDAQATLPGMVRPRYGRKIAGVCAGLALRYGWDVALVRVIALVLAASTCSLGCIAYAVLWIVMPDEPLYLPQTASASGPSVDNAR